MRLFRLNIGASEFRPRGQAGKQAGPKARTDALLGLIFFFLAEKRNLFLVLLSLSLRRPRPPPPLYVPPLPLMARIGGNREDECFKGPKEFFICGREAFVRSAIVCAIEKSIMQTRAHNNDLVFNMKAEPFSNGMGVSRSFYIQHCLILLQSVRRIHKSQEP